MHRSTIDGRAESCSLLLMRNRILTINNNEVVIFAIAIITHMYRILVKIQKSVVQYHTIPWGNSKYSYCFLNIICANVNESDNCTSRMIIIISINQEVCIYNQKSQVLEMIAINECTSLLNNETMM